MLLARLRIFGGVARMIMLRGGAGGRIPAAENGSENLRRPPLPNDRRAER